MCLDKVVIREEKLSRFLAATIRFSKSAYLNERFKILHDIPALSFSVESLSLSNATCQICSRTYNPARHKSE